MVIDLRPPSGPGLPPPRLPTPDWQKSSFFDDPSLRRVFDAPYYDDLIQSQLSPRRVGTILGGPTLSQAWDIVHPDPKKWSTIEPPRVLSSPVLSPLSAKPARDAGSKLGNFNLNLIRPFESLQDAYTEGIGQQGPGPYSPETVGLTDTIFGDISGLAGTSGISPMDILNWQGELPIKLMERPLAIAQVLASRVLGQPVPTDSDGEAVYPFQKDPAYWQWLATATEEQLVQFAKATAGQYLAPGRNQGLADSLLERFRQDQLGLTGLSSGSPEVDYHAKWAAWNASQGRPFSGSADWLNPLSPFVNIAGAVPFIGIDLQSWLAPVSPEIEQNWQSLTADDRQRYLEQQGYVLVGKNLVGMPFVFSGVSALATAAKASSIPTIARMGWAWQQTLHASNVAMAVGIGTTTAAWAAETFADGWVQELGRDINLAAPLSHSTLGAMLNQVGFFASGTFGAALAARTVKGVAAAFERGPAQGLLSQRIWGTNELPFFTYGYGGGRHVGILHETVPDVPAGLPEIAVKKSLMSYLVNAARLDRDAVLQLLGDRMATTPELDALPPAARDAWASQQIANAYANRDALIGFWADRLQRFRQSIPLLPSTRDIEAATATKWGVRQAVDKATVTLVERYGPTFFGSDLAAIQARVRDDLVALGYRPNMERMVSRLGGRDNVRTIEAWHQMARLVHQMGYIQRSGELHEMIRMDPPGSHEEGLTLFSQRTAFRDEMEAADVALRRNDAAARELAAQLVRDKDLLGRWYAQGRGIDPESPIVQPDPVLLADIIKDVLDQGGFPARRVNAQPGSEAWDLPLNQFHAKVAAEGRWELGFRESRPYQRPLTLTEFLDRELSPTEFAQLAPEQITLVDVAPEGYIELKPGMRFTRKNWYELDVIRTRDGHIYARDDGSLIGQQTPITHIRRPTQDPNNPQPFDRHRDTVSADEYDMLPEDQQRLAVSIHARYGTFTQFPDPLALTDTGQFLSGRNLGANWPILEHLATGGKYLFKARRSPAGLENLSPARRLAGPVATRLFRYFGLHTAEEAPFEWGGVEGTLQRLVDVDIALNLDNLSNTTPKHVIADLVKHHIVDWLTGQHDSNSDSFLLGNDGYVYGIDKGQAYKYFNELETSRAMLDSREFWTYRTRDALDTHLGEYLHDAFVDRGLELDWKDVEPLLRKIEDLPEDIYLASLQELAEARVADGRFEANVQEFYDAAIRRKRNIRIATAQAFDARGWAWLTQMRDTGFGAGWPQFTPGLRGLVDLESGSTVLLNERPVDTLATHVEVPEPSPAATQDHYKAGVVIREPDGRLWIVRPANNFGGYEATWPKGRVDVGESFQQAAIREALEETGLSVVIRKHLVDIPNEHGNVTRYYIAERTGGGPQYIGTPNEVRTVDLVTPQQARDFLVRNGAPEPRDQQLLAELDIWKANEEAAARQSSRENTPTEGAANADPVTVADPGTEMGYVSHARLRDGTVVETAWLDPDILDVNAVNLGNRGIAGRSFDAVFQAWRAWRIMETQKVGLHRALTRDYEFTGYQVDQFHSELLRLQQKYRGITMQTLGSLPDVSVLGAVANDVTKLAKDVFGEGPFLNRRTGKLDVIDFRREIVKAYRQSLRLNLLAGVTSHLKAMPGIGQFVIPVSDVVYPLFRYSLSFIFKPSEIAESYLLNLMRGVRRSGDPFTDALFISGGLGSGYGQLAIDRGYDLMLQGMTAFTPVMSGPDAAAGSILAGQRAQFGSDPFLYRRLDPAVLARRIAEEVAPREAFDTGGPKSLLSDSITGSPMELADPVRWPDEFPTSLRFLLEKVGETPEGQAILEVSGGKSTRRIVERERNLLIGQLMDRLVTNADAANSVGLGFALLRELPPGLVERLVDNIALVHTPVIRGSRAKGSGFQTSVEAQIAYMEKAIADGNPLFPGVLSTGRYSQAFYESHGGGTVGVVERAITEGESTTISANESAIGFGDAKYGGVAGAYITEDGLLVLVKPEAIKESLTVDTDRITYGNDLDLLREQMMTPAALNGKMRLLMQKALIDWSADQSKPFLDFIADAAPQYFSASGGPAEFAFLGGIRQDMIAAVMVPEHEIGRWTTFVANHPDLPLGDIKVVPYGTNTNASYHPAMWAHTLENAGLLDFAKTTPADILGERRFDDGILSLPTELFDQTLATATAGAAKLAHEIQLAANSLDLFAATTPSTRNHVLIARMKLTRELQALENQQLSSLVSPTTGSAATRHAVRPERLDETRRALATVEQLDRDWSALESRGEYQSWEHADAVAQSHPEQKDHAEAWMRELMELRARTRAAGISLENADLGSMVRVTDTRTGEVVYERPSSPAHIEANYEDSSSKPNYIDESRALLETYRERVPWGYVQASGYMSRGQAMLLQQTIDSPAFRSAIRARAEAKLGIALEDPVIRAYIRSPSPGRLRQTNGSFRDRSTTPVQSDDFLVTVQDGAGQPYGGLTLPELTELWQHYGVPQLIRERSVASSYRAEEAGAIMDPLGNRQASLMYGDGPLPGGRLFWYEDAPGGSYVDTPLGKNYVHEDHRQVYDVSFLHRFDTQNLSYVDLYHGHTLVKSSVSPEREGPNKISYNRKDPNGYIDWTYILTNENGITTAKVENIDEYSKRGSITLSVEALRDLIARGNQDAEMQRGVRYEPFGDYEIAALEHLAVRGELPDWLVAVRDDGTPINLPAMVRDLNPAARAATMEPAPATFTEVTPEGRLTERIMAELELLGKRGKQALHDLFINPVPWKQRAQDRLAFKLMRDRFPALVREEHPTAAGIFDEMKVPEGQWLNFLVHDRYLLDRWVQSGARADFEALVEHGGTYTGKADYQATRQALDELYTSAGFDTLLETLRLTMKGAHDEAYQVHFFSPYRSTFERSINHPILGVYPASWAYKVAKEWMRFLFQNQTLGFRAGMVPAQVIQQVTNAQAIAFAQQSNRSLEDFYEHGPYRNSIFIFNLLMPGDWSSLPFPLSRTVRDVARGNFNLYDVFERNIASIGVGRDIRLTASAIGELADTITGRLGEGPAFRNAQVPGWSLIGDPEIPVPSIETPPRDTFGIGR